MRHFHRGLGLALLALYVVVLTHRSHFLAGLEFVRSPIPLGGPRSANPLSGWLVALGLPLVAIVCFVWPRRLMWWFSPRTPPSYDYLLTENFWYCVGYAALIVGVGVLLLFRQPLVP